MFIPKKRTFNPGNAFENTAFLQVFENFRGCREAACEKHTISRFLAYNSFT
jgi:hypothetical protein